MPLKLEIVTPEREIFSNDVDMVVLPGIEGELGVLPQHAPLVTVLKPGELSYTVGGKTSFLAVGQGFVEVTHSTVSVMTDVAVGEADIDEKAVEEALQRAKDSLAGITNDEEVATVQAAIQKSLAQLHVKRRRRTSL